MQALARPSTNGTGGPYTAAQVFAQIMAPARAEGWAYDRLRADGSRYPLGNGGDLTPYVDRSAPPEIEHDTTRDVHRTLKLTLRGDAPLILLSDLIQVRYLLPMPDGGQAEFNLGVFTILPQGDRISPGVTWRQLQCADVGQLLIDGGFTTTFAAATGVGYVTAARSILSGLGGNTPLTLDIPAPTNANGTSKTLPAPLSWDAGSTRLGALNDLMNAINYFPVWMDGLTIRSSAIPDWSTVTPNATFDTTSGASIWRVPAQRKPDLSNVYNQVLLKVEDPRRTAFAVSAQNNDPASPVSVGRWHPKLATIQDSSVTDAATAQARAKTFLQQSAWRWTPYTWDSLAWPASQDHDVYRIVYRAKDEGGLVDSLYVETGWLMRCAPGEAMTRNLQQLLFSGVLNVSVSP